MRSWAYNRGGWVERKAKEKALYGKSLDLQAEQDPEACSGSNR